jgi:hypothetical protein
MTLRSLAGWTRKISPHLARVWLGSENDHSKITFTCHGGKRQVLALQVSAFPIVNRLCMRFCMST